MAKHFLVEVADADSGRDIRGHQGAARLGARAQRGEDLPSGWSPEAEAAPSPHLAWTQPIVLPRASQLHLLQMATVGLGHH